LKNQLLVNGKEAARKAGWNRLSDTVGARFDPRLGWRVESPLGTTDVLEWNGDRCESLGPRSIRTLRYDESIPDPYYIPGHGTEDFRDGGLHGIDPCGVDDHVRMHDRVMARMPVSLVNLDTGNPQTLAQIETHGYGYTLDGLGDTTVLPKYGKPREIRYDGMHDVRRRRFTMRHMADPFVMLDVKAVAHDMALAWDRKRADVIFKEPKGQGSPRIGREAAWVAIVAVDAGYVALADRMRKIFAHVQTPEGAIQVNSGGNPAPPPGKWMSDMEGHFLVQAMRALGMNREAKRLADLCCLRPIGKYIEHGTQRGDQSPTHGTAWAAMACGVYSRAQFREIATKWKVGPWPNGSMTGPFADPARVLQELVAWNQIGKTRTAIDLLKQAAMRRAG